MPEEVQAVAYEMLQDLLRSERRSNKLMAVQPRFWAEARAYLDTVTAEFRAEQARDPFGRKVMLLTDQVKNARHAAESLWAIRERKIAMMALAHSKDRKKPEGLLPDEAELYQRLVDLLDASRANAYGAPLAVSAPGPVSSAVGPAQVPVMAAPVTMPTAPGASTFPASVGPPAAPPVPAAPVSVPSDIVAEAEMVTIRALGDIPPFVGPDMQTYLLKEGDIATVPPSIARLLEKRKKAAILAV